MRCTIACLYFTFFYALPRIIFKSSQATWFARARGANAPDPWRCRALGSGRQEKVRYWPQTPGSAALPRHQHASTPTTAWTTSLLAGWLACLSGALQLRLRNSVPQFPTKDKLRINRRSTGYRVPLSVYIGFPSFVLSKGRSGQLSSMP